MTNNREVYTVHLHGHCKVADEEEKPFGIGCIGPSEGKMGECDSGAKKVRTTRWQRLPDRG